MKRSLPRGALLLVALGCAACGPDASRIVATPSGTAANLASYAFETAYGEIWEVDGELMPAAYENPWDAVILSQETSIERKSCSASSCSLDFKAYMTGLWHGTEQKITWTTDTLSGTATKLGYGWSCAVRISLTNCALAERTDVHNVRLDGACRWRATVSGEHSAWWGAFLDLQGFAVKVGQFGRVSASSLGAPDSFDECGSGGGGGDGEQVCFDFFLVWEDELGYHEVYLGTQCYEYAL